MKRTLLIASALIFLWSVYANAQSSNTFQNPPAGQPNLAHIGILNPPAPVLGGSGNTGGSTTYTYAVVAYGHDANSNLIPTLLGATATTTTGQTVLSVGTPITLTTQANPGSAQYDFLKLRNGVWQSLCLGVPVFSFTADGASCTDSGQVPQAYTLPTTNATIDLVAPYASIANLNNPQSGSPINQAPSQTGNYNAQGFVFNNLGCPGLQFDALAEGCAIGAIVPGPVFSSSGALNGTIGATSPNIGNFTSVSTSAGATLRGALTIAGNPGSTLDGVSIGGVTPGAIVAASMKLPGTGSVGCVQADGLGNFSITGSACGTGGGGGGTPAGATGQLQTNGGAGNFGAYAGSGPLATNSFANQITSAGTLLGRQPLFSDIGGAPCTVAQGCTNATAAGATAANNIGALAILSNGSDINSTSAFRTNLGLGSAALQPTPLDGIPGSFASLSPKNFAVPVTTGSGTVSCRAATGTTAPSWDWYQGKLTGNVTYTLPTAASNCVNNDAIGFEIVQDASHTVTFSPGAGTQIPATSCLPMPTGAGAIGEYYFIYNTNTTTPSWVEHCGNAPTVGLMFTENGNPAFSQAAAINTSYDLLNNASSGVTIPGGVLGTSGSIHVLLHGSYQNLNASLDNPSFGVTYGGQTIATGQLAAALGQNTSSTDEHQFYIDCYVAPAGLTTAEHGSCRISIETTRNMTNGSWGNLVSPDMMSENNAMTVNSATSQALRITYNDTASSNSVIVTYEDYVEVR